MESSPEGDFFVRSGPGTVKLPPESAKEYIRTRLATLTATLRPQGTRTGCDVNVSITGMHAPSTLAKSILSNRDRLARLIAAGSQADTASLDTTSVGRWIGARTTRVNVLIPTSRGPFALSLLEAFMQCLSAQNLRVVRPDGLGRDVLRPRRPVRPVARSGLTTRPAA